MKVIGYYPLYNVGGIEILNVDYDEMTVRYRVNGGLTTCIADIYEKALRDYNGDEEDYDLYLGFDYGDIFIPFRDIVLV